MEVESRNHQGQTILLSAHSNSTTITAQLMVTVHTLH